MSRRLNIRAIREQKGLTQRDLSIRAGLAGSVVCYAEKGNVSPRVETLQRIAQALNVTLDELLTA